MENVSVEYISQDNKQDQVLYITDEEIFEIQQLSKTEISCMAQVFFTAPINIISYPYININDQIIQLPLQGNYQDCQNYLANICLAIIKITYLNIGYNIFRCNYQQKCMLLSDQPFTIMTDDTKLCKILGCQKGKQYQSQLIRPDHLWYHELKQQEEPDFEAKYLIMFENKLFISIAKTLSLVCNDATQQNSFEKGKRRSLLLKAYYEGTPGQYLQINSSFVCNFYSNQLIRGIKVQFCDENYDQIELESNYKIVLVCQKLRRLVQEEQIESEDRAQRRQDQMNKKEQQQLQKEQLNNLIKEMTKQQQELFQQLQETNQKLVTTMQEQTIESQIQKQEELLKYLQEQFNNQLTYQNNNKSIILKQAFNQYKNLSCKLQKQEQQISKVKDDVSDTHKELLQQNKLVLEVGQDVVDTYNELITQDKQNKLTREEDKDYIIRTLDVGMPVIKLDHKLDDIK